jgi:hypothetical protein
MALWLKNLSGKGNLGDIDIDERIILKRISVKYIVRMLAVFIRLCVWSKKRNKALAFIIEAWLFE